LGAVIGIIAFSRILSWLLKHYENLTIAALVGFMLGSLRLIWMEAAKGVDVISDSGSLNGGQWGIVVFVLVIGFLVVSLLDHLQSRTNPVFAWAWRPGKPIDSNPRM
jgi:putative membrane protein